jgi:hypothetical protein
MLRRLLTFLSALSLLLCVATAITSMCRGQRVDVVGLEQVALSGNDGSYSAIYLGGTSQGLEAGRWATQYPNTDNADWYSAHRTRRWRWFHGDRQFGVFSGLKRPLSIWERLGFDRTHLRQRTWDEDATRIVCLTQHDAISAPWWFITLLTALLPAVQGSRCLGRWCRRRRYPAGLCPTCGYDLRASRERCPECGSPIHQSTIETQNSRTT